MFPRKENTCVILAASVVSIIPFVYNMNKRERESEREKRERKEPLVIAFEQPRIRSIVQGTEFKSSASNIIGDEEEGTATSTGGSLDDDSISSISTTAYRRLIERDKEGVDKLNKRGKEECRRRIPFFSFNGN